MADSSITKNALANAMKELIIEVPFEKINVSHICERCNMNRKSFYYHFKDKYDLVNWIFDTEFISVINQNGYQNGWEFLLKLCCYLYDNKDFYRKALKIKGQNSFSNHFREMMIPVIKEYLCTLLFDQDVIQFQVDFFVDAFVCSIERWIMDKNCIEPSEFINLLKNCVHKTAVKVYHEMELG